MIKNKDPLLDYLINPFNELVDSLIKTPKYNVANFATGLTGQGKTYAITKNHLNKLFSDTNVKLVIYSVPDSAVLENDKFEDALEDIDGTIKFVTTSYDAMKYLRRGKKVVFNTHHAGVWTKTSKYGKILIKYIEDNLKDKVAIFIDEAHTWMVSHPDNYKDVSGNKPSTYNASLYNGLSKIASISSFIFAITATPNREAKSKISTIGSMKFKFYNTLPPKALMMYRNSWFNKKMVFNASDKESVKETLLEMLKDMKADEAITGVKKTAMIQVKANYKESKKWGGDISEIGKLLTEINNEYKIFPTNELLYIKLDKDTKESYSTDNNKKVVYDTEDEIKEELDDITSSVRIILVVEKGKAGMNVYSLKYLMSLREYNSKDYRSDEFGVMTETAIQIMGRLVRLYAGMSNEKFDKISGYNIINYIKTNPKLIEKIKILNSFNVYVPNNYVWGEAIKEFEELYVTKLKDVIFDNLSEIEICPECNGTGIVGGTSKIIDFTKKDMKNIDKVFKIA